MLRPDGVGVATAVDSRGRLYVAIWLRRQVAEDGVVLLAARRPAASVVVLAATAALDGLMTGLARREEDA